MCAAGNITLADCAFSTPTIAIAELRPFSLLPMRRFVFVVADLPPGPYSTNGLR
jgi:hypothetical protein